MYTIRLDDTIGVLGDVHGSPNFLHEMFAWFKRHGVRDVVQVGDFWFYTGRDLVKLERLTKRFDINFHFLDGNHEDYRYLGAAVHTPIPVAFGERITYLGRGARGTFGDTSFMVMGGAVSTDRMFRKVDKDWFHEENLTDLDVAHGTAGSPVDVLFTHDIATELRTEHTTMQDFDGITNTSLMEYELRMREVVRYHEPRMVLHGHYHKYYVADLTSYAGAQRRVVGLGADTAKRGSALVLNDALEIVARYGS